MAVVTDPRQVLDVLRKLQAIDDEIHDVRESRSSMIGNLARLNTVLTQRGNQLVEMRAKLGEAETWFAKKSLDLELEREKLTKAKAKMTVVSRSREYVAVNRELDNIRKNIGHREDEVERLSTAIAEFRTTIESEDEKVRDMRALAETEESSSRESLAEMRARSPRSTRAATRSPARSTASSCAATRRSSRPAKAAPLCRLSVTHAAAAR